MNQLTEKEKTAIERLKAFAPKTELYYLCYSGGKDSDVIRILATLADVPHEIHHNLTSADAPETIRCIRSIPGVIIDRRHYDDGTPSTMWNLIPKKMIPPTRIARYCCEWLKEHGGEGRLRITGVRWAESNNRKENADVVRIFKKPANTIATAEEIGADYTLNKKGGILLRSQNDENRRLVESCYRDRSTTVNPIVDWTDVDVWSFLHHYGCNTNPLYSMGYSRIGCILCPLGGSRCMKREAADFPEYKNLYIRAFERMLDARRQKGLKTNSHWADGESVFRWWVGDDPTQTTMQDYLEAVKEDDNV